MTNPGAAGQAVSGTHPESTHVDAPFNVCCTKPAHYFAGVEQLICQPAVDGTAAHENSG